MRSEGSEELEGWGEEEALDEEAARGAERWAAVAAFIWSWLPFKGMAC